MTYMKQAPIYTFSISKLTESVRRSFSVAHETVHDAS